MKHRSIYSLLLLALMALFWAPVFVNAWIPGAQADQDLGFKLVGTAVTDDPSKNFAIMENQSTQNQRACREGDRLGEIVIKRILSGKVIIGTQMGDQILSMGAGGDAGGVQFPPQTARLDRKEVDSALPDYMRLIYEIRVRPHFEAGLPGGFLIYNIEPGSIFSRIGLENGDVIVSVNGKSVTTTQQAVEFYDALKAGGTVDIEIKRGEGAQGLHFEIR